jgi:preprotein translocase subunit SecE
MPRVENNHKVKNATVLVLGAVAVISFFIAVSIVVYLTVSG